LRKLRSIQILRGLAACSVVVFHATNFAYGPFGVGAAGVDLFFVISGLIMAEVSTGRDAWSFVGARLWRVFPLYLVCAAFYQIAFPPPHPATCATVMSWTLLPLGCSPYLQVAWTLSYEMVFYALVAATIKKSVLIYPATALIFFLPPIADHGSNLMMLEFLAGFTLKRLPLNTVAGGAATALALVGYATAPVHIGEYGEAPFRVLTWGIPSTLLVYGALSFERWLSRLKPLVRLGDASYSIYLVHLMVLYPLHMAWPIEIYAAIASGYLVHLALERPLLNARIFLSRHQLGAVVLK
jgi:exopolysaccharide production protein ExoZ